MPPAQPASKVLRLQVAIAWVIAAIVLVPALWLVGGMCWNTWATGAAYGQDKTHAIAESRKAVLAELEGQGTITFPDDLAPTAQRHADGSWSVTGVVDVAGRERRTWTCRVWMETASGRWLVRQLEVR